MYDVKKEVAAVQDKKLYEKYKGKYYKEESELNPKKVVDSAKADVMKAVDKKKIYN